VRTPDVYLVPRADGELVVGATMEERGFDVTTTAGAALTLLKDACRTVPGCAELVIAEIAAGLRPALRDGLPAIGAGGPPGLYVATGHYRHGVLLAPATARFLVDEIDGGRPAPQLAAFRPGRFEVCGVA
jgi:glycine oxidase